MAYRRKICILASLAYGKHVYPENVHTEGITDITLDDVNLAEAFGYVIKLIGRVKKLESGKIDILTAPMLVPFKSQLSNIDNEFNGIMVRGDCTGDVVFYGKGAGKLPTASAVVADVVDCCKHLKARRFLFWADGDGKNIIDWRDSVSAMFLRVTGADAAAKTEAAFGEISTVSDGDMLAVITSEIAYRDFEAKRQALESEGVQVLSAIRVSKL